MSLRPLSCAFPEVTSCGMHFRRNVAGGSHHGNRGPQEPGPWKHAMASQLQAPASCLASLSPRFRTCKTGGNPLPGLASGGQRAVPRRHQPWDEPPSPLTSHVAWASPSPVPWARGSHLWAEKGSPTSNSWPGRAPGGQTHTDDLFTCKKTFLNRRCSRVAHTLTPRREREGRASSPSLTPSAHSAHPHTRAGPTRIPSLPSFPESRYENASVCPHRVQKPHKHVPAYDPAAPRPAVPWEKGNLCPQRDKMGTGRSQ